MSARPASPFPERVFCLRRELVMSVDEKEKVDATSAEFKQGVGAGLNSEEDTKNWKAGNELGQELKDEGETAGPVPGNA